MLPNLVKYCVDCFSLLFSVLVVLGTSPAASVAVWWIPQRGYCKGRAQHLGHICFSFFFFEAMMSFFGSTQNSIKLGD